MQSTVVPELVIYENTDEYTRDLAEAETRFARLRAELFARGFQATSFDDVRIGWDLVPEVWLNSSHPYFNEKPDAKRAIALALKHGETGWWTLDEIEKFTNAKTAQDFRIFEAGMAYYRFRRARKPGMVWSRMGFKEQRPHISGLRLPRPQVETDIDEFTWRFRDKRRGVNVETRMGETYHLDATPNEIIYVQVDPSYDGSHHGRHRQLALPIFEAFHIAYEQRGFTIKAQNLAVVDGEAREDFLLVTVHTEDGYRQWVWPRVVANGQALIDLLQTLP